MKTVGKVSAVMVCITLGCLSFQAVDQAQNTVSNSSRLGRQHGASIVPPVTYSGILPCVACVGREFTLSLRPDGLFLLRQVYLSKEKGKDKTLVEQGSWRSTTDGGRLSLWGGIEMHQQFAIRDADTLRMLDDRGREIQSTLNYDLVRSKLLILLNSPSGSAGCTCAKPTGLRNRLHQGTKVSSRSGARHGRAEHRLWNG